MVDPTDDSVRRFTSLRTIAMLNRALRNSSLTDIANDVALVLLDPARIGSEDEWRALLEVRTGRPTFSVASPPFQAVGSTNDISIRKLVTLDPVEHDVAGRWFIRSRFAPGIEVQPGDSGGPLFVESSGVRNPVGLISAVAQIDQDPYSEFADLTRAAAADFIRTNAQDLGRSASWVGRHGRREPWWGEVDYTGPCDQSRDSDCDHWYFEHDNCPIVFNPLQEDQDDDGLGDACDNCVAVSNVGQENCNAIAEAANPAPNGLKFLGDACDPVPCPRSDLGDRETAGEICRSAGQFEPVAGPCLPTEPTCNCTSQRVQPLTTGRPIAGAGNGVVANVPTTFRFCQRGTAFDGRFVDCTSDPTWIRNSQLSRAEPTDNPRSEAPWHAVTLGAGGFPSQSIPSPRGEERRWDYGVTVATIKWFFGDDLHYWSSATRNMIPVTDRLDYPACLASDGQLQPWCLNGVFWVHGRTAVGSAQRGETASESELSSTHFNWRPAEPQKAYCLIRPALVPVGQLRTMSATLTGSSLRSGELLLPSRLLGSADLSPRRTTAFVTATSFGLSSLLEGERALKLAPTDDNCFADAISRSDAETILSHDWFSAVEPGSYISREPLDGDKPLAIGLGTDRLVNARLLATSTGISIPCAEFYECLDLFGSDRAGIDMCIELEPDDACVAPYRPRAQLFSTAARLGSNTVPPPRTSTFALYSRHLDGYFLLGGKTDSGVELSDVWFHPVLQGDWAEITPTAAIGRVLAATYSFGDGRLWIVDELGDGPHGNVRLLTLSLDGKVEVLFHGARHGPPALVPYLSVDNDGAVLVALSGADAYRLYRVTSTPCRTLERMRGGSGHLVRPVIVDESGYSFILEGANGSLRLDRRWIEDTDDKGRDLDDDRRACWPRAKGRNDARNERCADDARRRACERSGDDEVGRLF